MANSKSSCSTLYVSNLHPNVTEKVLYEKFEYYGNILSIQVCRDYATRKSLGYAYVNFEHGADAKEAMYYLNSDYTYGRPIRVVWFKKDTAEKNLDLNRNDAPITSRVPNKKQIQEQRQPRSGFNIFVKNFGSNFTNKTLKKEFEICGEVVSANIVLDGQGNSRGFGLVGFRELTDALRAIKMFDGKIINGKPIHVERERNKTDGVKTTDERKFNQDRQQLKSEVNLCVKNLPWDINDDSLKAHFDRFGMIISADVVRNREDNTSRGFGFVCFSSPEEARCAMNEMNGACLGTRPLKVAPAFENVNSKNQLRSAELQAQYKESMMKHVKQLKSEVNQHIRKLEEQTYRDNLGIRAGGIEHPTRTTVRTRENKFHNGFKADKSDINSQIDSEPTRKTSNSDIKDKQLLMEKIYPLVGKIAGNMTGKITGMLLGYSNAELLDFIENEDLLRKKINKALKMVKANS